MKLIKKIIFFPNRKSRLHNAKNELYLKSLLYFPIAFYHYFKINFFKDSSLPMINYDTLNIFKKILKNKIKVLEYGSGGSTLWWLKQKNLIKICSVEFNKDWFNKIKFLKSKNRNENKLELKFNTLNFFENFDLIIIDGGKRDYILQKVIENNLSVNSIIYFDNTDRELENEERKRSIKIIQEYSKKKNLITKEVCNFRPGGLFVTCGTFIYSKSSVLNKIIK